MTLSKKYLRKNEFRYDTNPNVRRNDGEFHTAYVSAKHGHKSKINIITHSNNFYGQPTREMYKNPNRSKFDKRKSRFSVPVWENDTYLKDQPKGQWKLHKKDYKAIRTANKKYLKSNKWQ